MCSGCDNPSQQSLPGLNDLGTINLGLALGGHAWEKNAESFSDTGGPFISPLENGVFFEVPE